MKNGCRIKKIRLLRGLTQRELGLRLGFNEPTADVRVAQYEAGARSPKPELVSRLASVLDVSEGSLSVTEFKSINEVIHFLFLLEDEFGLRANVINNRLCLSFEKTDTAAPCADLIKFFAAWESKANELRSGVITLEEYHNWRYKFCCEDLK